MAIEDDKLFKFGADILDLKKDELLFMHNDYPFYYYQIKKGSIKLISFQDKNKEFIQGFCSVGDSVAGVYVFSEQPYPMNAVAIEDCTILRLEHQNFFELLKTDFEIQLKFLRHIAKQVSFTHNLLNTIVFNSATSSLQTFLDYLKSEHSQSDPYSYQVPYTRKEISLLTGMRIETVIRTFKKMENEHIIKIVKGKIFY